LKQHPGDFNNVALILHDKLETVMREYAHLSTADGISKLNEHTKKMHAESQNKNGKKENTQSATISVNDLVKENQELKKRLAALEAENKRRS